MADSEGFSGTEDDDAFEEAPRKQAKVHEEKPRKEKEKDSGREKPKKDKAAAKLGITTKKRKKKAKVITDSPDIDGEPEGEEAEATAAELRGAGMDDEGEGWRQASSSPPRPPRSSPRRSPARQPAAPPVVVLDVDDDAGSGPGSPPVSSKKRPRPSPKSADKARGGRPDAAQVTGSSQSDAKAAGPVAERAAPVPARPAPAVVAFKHAPKNSIGESGARAHVLAYMQLANRPFVGAQVATNLQEAVPSKLLLKTLDALASDNLISAKEVRRGAERRTTDRQSRAGCVARSPPLPRTPPARPRPPSEWKVQGVFRKPGLGPRLVGGGVGRAEGG